MSSTPGPNILRSIAAVIAGLLIIFALLVPMWCCTRRESSCPGSSRWLAHGGCWRWLTGAFMPCLVATSRAGSRPTTMKHAILLGVIGLFLSTVGVVSTWNAGPEFGPKWYALVLVASSLPCAWVGGKLARR